MAVGEHWVYQGRQAHGWFGSGTAPESENSKASLGKNRLFDAANAGQRVDYAASSIIGHVPRAQRAGWASALSDATNERLKTAVAAWYGASALSRDEFRNRFLDPYTSDGTVDHLRQAARRMVEAQTYEDLARSGQNLAEAAPQVGVDRWPRYVADAGRRAVVAVEDGAVSGVVKAGASGTNSEKAVVPGGLLLLLYFLHERNSDPPRPPPTPSKPSVVQQSNPGGNNGPAEEGSKDGLAKPGDATLSEDRRDYILNGVGGRRGGHGPGRDTPGKSKFPADWSDDRTIDDRRDQGRGERPGICAGSRRWRPHSCERNPRRR